MIPAESDGGTSQTTHTPRIKGQPTLAAATRPPSRPPCYDPFAAAPPAVAQALGRQSVKLDLNAEYLAIAAKRIGQVSLPMELA